MQIGYPRIAVSARRCRPPRRSFPDDGNYRPRTDPGKREKEVPSPALRAGAHVNSSSAVVSTRLDLVSASRGTELARGTALAAFRLL